MRKHWEGMTLSNLSGEGGMEDIKSCFLLSLPIIYPGFMSMFNISAMYNSSNLQCIIIVTSLWCHIRHWQRATLRVKIGAYQEMSAILFLFLFFFFFFKQMINFKPNQRNNTFEGVEVISNSYFIVYFGSKPGRQKGRPCNKISFTKLLIFLYIFIFLFFYCSWAEDLETLWHILTRLGGFLKLPLFSFC